MKYLVTIGTFDGIHRGHRTLIRQAVRSARKQGLNSLMILFETPPRLFFNHRLEIPLINTPQERTELVKACGVDKVRTLKFNARLASMTAKRFLTQFLIKKNKMGALMLGADSALGKGREGTPEVLKGLCRELGIPFAVCRLLSPKQRKISSRRIRELLLQGKVNEAEKLLGYRYFLNGSVQGGRRLGSKIGFPTANLKVDSRKILPPGVFAAKVRIGKKNYRGAVNIGRRPTLNKNAPLGVEVHVLNFKGNLYGRQLRVELVKRIRGEKKFKSLRALQRQIQKDVASVTAVLTT